VSFSDDPPRASSIRACILDAEGKVPRIITRFKPVRLRRSFSITGRHVRRRAAVSNP
jgi:hypothetical protein